MATGGDGPRGSSHNNNNNNIRATTLPTNESRLFHADENHLLQPTFRTGTAHLRTKVQTLAQQLVAAIDKQLVAANSPTTTMPAPATAAAQRAMLDAASSASAPATYAADTSLSASTAISSHSGAYEL